MRGRTCGKRWIGTDGGRAEAQQCGVHTRDGRGRGGGSREMYPHARTHSRQERQLATPRNVTLKPQMRVADERQLPLLAHAPQPTGTEQGCFVLERRTDCAIYVCKGASRPLPARHHQLHMAGHRFEQQGGPGPALSTDCTSSHLLRVPAYTRCRRHCPLKMYPAAPHPGGGRCVRPAGRCMDGWPGRLGDDFKLCHTYVYKHNFIPYVNI